MTAENNSLMVKDLILKGDEFNELKNKPKNKRVAARYVYSVVMESGCDFAIARREVGKRKVTRLVILVSQEQYYIESGSSKEALTRSMFKSFIKGLKNDEKIFLPNVNWLDYLENNRFFCSRFMDILSEDWGDSLRERLDMIRHGDLFFTNSSIFCKRGFGEERYIESDHICTCDFAPHEDNEHIFNRFGNPQNMDVQIAADPYGPTAVAFYDPEGEIGTINPTYRIKLYGDYNPPKINEEIGMCYASYERLQQAMFTLSAPLYKYMLQMLSKRRGITKKTLLSDIIPDWETQESMLFQSFGAFAFIQQAFGMDVAKRAMDIYIESDVRDIIPAGRMSVFLYGSRPFYTLPPYYGGFFGDSTGVEDKKPLYEFDKGSFLEYLFKSSVKQGYGKNMNLFLYQWGQTMFLQDVLELKKTDKYPKHLASKNVELMSMMMDYTSKIEKRMWRSAVDYAKPLEYKNDKYQIIVPQNTNDLIKEAANQSNCLRTYESQILRRDTRVCFLRPVDTEKADRSLVTIEVDNEGRVTQCKARYNSNPSVSLWKFILEWEKARSLTDATYCIPEELREGHLFNLDMEDEL